MIPLADLAPGVRDTDDSLIVEVQSTSRPRVWHRVDLSAYSGFGHCMCEVFQLRLNGHVRQAPVPREAMECRHIRKARRYLALAVAQRIIQQRAQNPNPKLTRRERANPPW